MAEQGWEYCALWLNSIDHKVTGGVLRKEEHFWSYDCDVKYYCPSGDVIGHQLATLNKSLPFNPFNKAMALLGGAGWELVSIQHANTPAAGMLDVRISWSNCVAYFKRPSIPGRAVNDPKLSI